MTEFIALFIGVSVVVTVGVIGIVMVAIKLGMLPGIHLSKAKATPVAYHEVCVQSVDESFISLLSELPDAGGIVINIPSKAKKEIAKPTYMNPMGETRVSSCSPSFVEALA